MNRTAREIYDDFEGKLIGTRLMKEHVCSVLSFMPPKTIKFVTEKCWFMSSMDDAYAFTFTGNDLRGQHLIFLSDDLFKQSVSQIKYTICHEIGHVILGHRNSTITKQTKSEIRKQEKEADIFAKKYSNL